MPEIPPEIEQQLASMSDGEFAALTARLRAPDTDEAFRDIAKTMASEDVVDSFMRVANVAAFVGPDGQIDEGKVRATLGPLFGAPGNGQQFGSGDAGRAEAQRRRGGAGQETTTQRNGAPGSAGRSEAQRRLAAKGDGDDFHA